MSLQRSAAAAGETKRFLIRAAVVLVIIGALLAFVKVCLVDPVREAAAQTSAI